MYIPDKAFSNNPHAGGYCKTGGKVYFYLRDTLQAVPRNLSISFRYVISHDTKDAEQFSH